MTASWRAAVLLLGAACAGSTPPLQAPAPAAAPGDRPSLDPDRTDSPAQESIRYPASGTGIMRYQLARRDSIAVTMPSGESQLQVNGSTAFATLTWAASDSGTHIEARVDSLVADSGAALPFAQVDSVQQARWTFFRAPSGRITEVSGGPASLRGDQVRDQLVLLFPPLPAGGWRAGLSWSDSALVPARVSAFEATERAEVLAQAAPRPGPRRSLGVTVIRSRTATGEGTQFGQAITVQATGVDTLDFVLSLDGRVESSSGTRVTDLVVGLPAIGQSVPAHQVSFLKATLLP